jgi:hypothetical protein
MNTNTASLRNSQCSSIPIPQDKSNYWFPVRAIIPLRVSISLMRDLLALVFSVRDRVIRTLLVLKPCRWANGSFSSLDGGAVMYVFFFFSLPRPHSLFSFSSCGLSPSLSYFRQGTFSPWS